MDKDTKDKAVPVIPAAEFVDLEMEILEFPCTDSTGRKFGIEKADEILSTFADCGLAGKVPVVPGHDEAHPILKASGLPAFGWGQSLAKKAVEGGVKIIARVSQIPAKVADLLQKGAWKRVSGAFWLDGGKAGFAAAGGRAVLRHIGLLGADVPQIKTLDDVKALYDGRDAPQAAFADEDDSNVAEFGDVAATAEPEKPPTLAAAVAGESDADTLRPLFSGIQDSKAIIEGLKGLAAELGLICEKMSASPGMPPAAAAMSDAAKPEAVVAPIPSVSQPAPGSPAPGPAAVEMTDDVRQSVEVAITRMTADGRLLPKHHKALRVQASAMFAGGGAEAVASFLDDQDRLRQAKVIEFGDTAPASKPGTGSRESGGATAEFADADPGAVAEAEAEFERGGFGRSLGVTKEAYVRASVVRKR